MYKVFGDSFTANKQGWTKYFNHTGYGSNGSSEYRIYRNFIQNYNSGDLTIFCHTHWSRLFLKDENRSLLSRLLPSHPDCDIVLSDVSTKKEKQFVDVLNTIWDEEFFKTTYWLYVEKMLAVPNSIHITFFEDICHPQIHNLHDLWMANKGSINHMDDTGNRLVYDYIKQYF